MYHIDIYIYINVYVHICELHILFLLSIVLQKNLKTKNISILTSCMVELLWVETIVPELLVEDIPSKILINTMRLVLQRLVIIYISY